MNLYISNDCSDYYYFSNLEELHDTYCFKCLEEKKILTKEEWDFERANEVIAEEWKEHEMYPEYTPKPNNKDYMKELRWIRENEGEVYNHYVKEKLFKAHNTGLVTTLKNIQKLMCFDHLTPLIKNNERKNINEYYLCSNCEHVYQNISKIEKINFEESGLCNICHIQLLKTKLENITKNNYKI